MSAMFAMMLSVAANSREQTVQEATIHGGGFHAKAVCYPASMLACLQIDTHHYHPRNTNKESLFVSVFLSVCVSVFCLSDSVAVSVVGFFFCLCGCLCVRLCPFFCLLCFVSLCLCLFVSVFVCPCVCMFVSVCRCVCLLVCPLLFWLALSGFSTCLSVCVLFRLSVRLSVRRFLFLSVRLPVHPVSCLH